MMLRRLALALLLFTAPGFAATPAVFRGRVVELAKAEAAPGTIYVLSRNGSLRKVKVAEARVAYGTDVPSRFRKALPHKSLVHGAEVRVEAEENGAGLWTARAIEILQVPGSPKPREAPVPPAGRHPAPTLSRRST